MRTPQDTAGRIADCGASVLGRIVAWAMLALMTLLSLGAAVFLMLLPAGLAHAAEPVTGLQRGLSEKHRQISDTGPAPQAAPYRAELLRAAHSAWGLDAPVAMLAAQVHAESAWQPGAVSRVGAAGLAQFMPQTAAWWCKFDRTAAANCLPQNPTWALRAMAGYDRWLFDRLAAAGADEGDRLWAVLRSYNGGLGHWLAESALAADRTRVHADAACGRARRAVQFCAENLGYPQRILLTLQPRYASWGRVVKVTGGAS